MSKTVRTLKNTKSASQPSRDGEVETVATIETPNVQPTITVRKSPKKKSVKIVENVEVIPTTHPTEEDEVSEDNAETSVRTKRPAPTKEDVFDSFDELLNVIDEELRVLGESNGKVKGSKFLRSISKRIKKLRTQTTRVLKKRKTKTKRDGGTNMKCGFLKPVFISTELAKFTGWNPTEKKSRVDATRYICKYIKENKLFDKDDKRIIYPDKELTKILKVDKKGTNQCKYDSLQTMIKHNFTDNITA